jgi:mono/diheme cytochrome c family protein
MPAWKNTLSETQTWQLVTFLSNVQKLPPAARKELELTPSAEVGAAAATVPAPSAMHMK